MRAILAFLSGLSLSLALAGGPASAGETRLDELFAALASASAGEAPVIEDEIWGIWSHSGSATIDLLLERGRKALEAGDAEAAIEHFTALVDHAPDFAEGWNSRATAYYLAGLYGPALSDIQRALALEPRHFGALGGLGVIFEEIGEHDLAREAFEEVLRLHPNREDIRDALDRIEAQYDGTAL